MYGERYPCSSDDFNRHIVGGMSAREFFSAVDRAGIASGSLDATSWLDVPQGLVHPAMAPEIAKQIGIKPEDVLLVAHNQLAIIGGRLVPTKDLELVLSVAREQAERNGNPDPSYAELCAIAETRAGHALVAAGAEPTSILWRVPMFDDPLLLVSLANVSIQDYQQSLDSYYELDAPSLIINFESSVVQTVLEALVNYFTAGVDPWRPQWWPDDEPNRVLWLGGLAGNYWSVSNVASPAPSPLKPVQILLCDDERVAVLYPFVALVLRIQGSVAIVEDAFCTMGNRAMWTIGGAIGFEPIPCSGYDNKIPVRDGGGWLAEPSPVIPRFVPCDDASKYEVSGALVFDTVQNQYAYMSRWGAYGGAEVRTISADGAYCVLVRWLDQAHSKIGRTSLVCVATGEPIPTKYDASLNRARAIAFHDSTLHIAVNGQAIRDSRRVATYPINTVVAFDSQGRNFAYANENTVVLIDTTTQRTRSIDLLPLAQYLVPAELPNPNSDDLLLYGIGATPLIPETLEALKHQLSERWNPWDDSKFPFSDGELEVVLAARAIGWPQLSVQT
jgi:hypothetical protein